MYDASYTDNLGNYKLVRIKECYPHALKMTRDEDGTLHPSADDGKAFDAAKKRLIAAYQKNNALFSLDGLANVIANTSDIYEANGTVYIVSVYMNGRTFAEHQGDTLHDCVSLLIGAAKALRHIHNAGYLYLDLKPDNILTLEGSLDLVQLFDFDSIITPASCASPIPKAMPHWSNRPENFGSLENTLIFTAWVPCCSMPCGTRRPLPSIAILRLFTIMRR